MSANATGWDQGATLNGMRLRKAARVLLFDPNQRVLLARGHDSDRPERAWWFTIGGGIDQGETPEEAAIREVLEETGIELVPEQLVGPVLRRTAIFDFEAEHCVQQEVFYMVQLACVPRLSRAGWTDVESSFLEDIEWLSAKEIGGLDVEVFPANLAQVVESLADGWDGTVMELGLMSE